jgi:hypothetical protein
MLIVITLVVLITLSVASLLLGVLSMIAYGKNTGVRVRQTQDEPLPGTEACACGESLDCAPGESSRSFSWNKTRGKKVEFHFSVSYDELREGLRRRDPLRMLQFRIGLFLILFIYFSLMAIGAGLLLSGVGFLFGAVFVGAGNLLLVFFLAQLLFGSKSPS